MSDEARDKSPTVADGKLMRLSPTGLLKGDTNAPGGCLRRWFFRYVMRRPEPSKKAQDTGKRCHAEIEHYLKTGEDVRGPIARALARFTPRPGPDLLIEHDIAGELLCAGVPMIGYTDLIHTRGRATLQDEQDPDGTWEGIDWKFVGGWDYIKTPLELRDDVQLTTYGMFGLRVSKKHTGRELEWWRASHGYSKTKGAPEARKVSALIPAEHLVRRWEYVEGVGRSLHHVAAETEADKVPANVRACGAFGGCPHASVCSAGRHDSLASIFGAEGATEIMTPRKKEPMPATDMLDSLTETPTEKRERLRREMEALEAEEAAAAAPPKVDVSPAFAEACKTIEVSGMGSPGLKGEAAKLYAALTSRELPESGAFLGVGKLGRLELADPAQVVQLSNELKQAASARDAKAEPAGNVPTDTPKSSAKVEDREPPKSEPKAEEKEDDGHDPADRSDKRHKSGGGRPKKPRPENEKPAGFSEVTILVNVIGSVVGTTFDTTPLTGYAYDLAAELAKRIGTPDIRMSDDKALDYGKWKGVIAAMAIKSPPTPGVYTVFGDDEVEMTVVRALARIPGVTLLTGVRS